MFIDAFSYTLQCLSVDPAQRIRRCKHSLTANTFTSARIMPLLASSMGEEHPGPDGHRPQADPRRAGLVPQAGSTVHSWELTVEGALASKGGKRPFPMPVGARPPRELAVGSSALVAGARWRRHPHRIEPPSSSVRSQTSAL